MRLLALVPALLISVGAGAADLSSAQVVDTYATIAYRTYADSVTSAKALQAAIYAFTAKPSAEGLLAAKAAWLAAREDYGPSEVFRFCNGPIDAEPDNIETKINAWPLDEQWVDYTADTPDSGVINDAKGHPSFSGEVLVELNEQGGEKNIAAGYHAIEFLLWGQDRSKTGPGERPFTDYVDGGTAKNQDRRRAYLVQAADLLVKHLERVAHAWEPAVAGNHRAQLLAGKPEEALKAAFTGAIMLAGDELSGERLAVAYETQDQEEEQSCFSDNTHRDTILNAEGIQRVWLGQFKDIRGPGLKDLVEAKDPQAASVATSRVAAAVAAAKAVPAPFDQAIQGVDGDAGRKAVLATIQELENEADELVVAAKAIGVDIEFGANANNAIVGIKDLQAQLPAVVVAVKAGDKAAAKAAVDVLFERWLRFETAISREAPTNYRAIESAMNAVRNEAVRAKQPDAAKAQAAGDTLIKALDAVLPLLKKE